jgi:hypothetical protein
MDKTNDSIIFESRAEIGVTICALEDWMQDHPNDRNRETISRLVRLLDAMEMSW